jgi:solute carrier family 8 (sodium/calcium exchanger)
MALGSSAPEILLSVIESLKDLGKPAGVLGPASIVGSGAFNLLVITGISIISVDAPKKIYDLRVYAVTATFSLFSYAWMFICLEVTSPEIVTMGEAWLTLFFFFLLVGTAFIADKFTERVENKKKSDKE